MHLWPSIRFGPAQSAPPPPAHLSVWRTTAVLSAHESHVLTVPDRASARDFFYKYVALNVIELQ